MNAFAIRIVELYAKGRVVAITSYTRYMITLLKEHPITYPSPGGGLKSLGGDKVTQPVIDACIRKMGPWVKLSIHVLRSEYPSFELVQSFKIFSLGGKTTGAVGTEAIRNEVEKLAALVGVDATEAESQLDCVRQIALQSFSSADYKGDAVRAWVEAVKRYEAAYTTSLTSLRPILYRFMVYRACTSAVEQNFSLMERYFHKRRDALQDAALNVQAKLILDAHDQCRNIICKDAQNIWIEHYGKPRTHCRDRIDKGQACFLLKNLSPPPDLSVQVVYKMIP